MFLSTFDLNIEWLLLVILLNIAIIAIIIIIIAIIIVIIIIKRGLEGVHWIDMRRRQLQSA